MDHVDSFSDARKHNLRSLNHLLVLCKTSIPRSENATQKWFYSACTRASSVWQSLSLPRHRHVNSVGLLRIVLGCYAQMQAECRQSCQNAIHKLLYMPAAQLGHATKLEVNKLAKQPQHVTYFYTYRRTRTCMHAYIFYCKSKCSYLH